ncbi:MAG: hypothetical protein U1F49_03230 [Rubrivivax sp.]
MLGDDAAEEGVGARIGRFALEALEGERHGHEHAERRGQPRQQHGERQAQADGHRALVMKA